MKRIIILNRTTPWVGQMGITYAMWADVPIARQPKYVKPIDWVSAYDGADATELSNLRSGIVTEKVETTNIPIGTPVATIKQILQDSFNSFQGQVTNDNTWQFYGSFFDGTTWTIGGV